MASDQFQATLAWKPVGVHAGSACSPSRIEVWECDRGQPARPIVHVPACGRGSRRQDLTFCDAAPKERAASPQKSDRKQCHRIASATHTSEPKQGRKVLLVSSLPRSATRSDLRSFFSRFGKLAYVTLERDAKGISKCYGFVGFDTPQAAQETKRRCGAGLVIMPDIAGKNWQIRASWAESQHRQG